MIGATHDPSTRSWAARAEGHADFPVQNLPLGVFSPPGSGPRIGCAIGDEIVLEARAREPRAASIGFGACRAMATPAR